MCHIDRHVGAMAKHFCRCSPQILCPNSVVLRDSFTYDCKCLHKFICGCLQMFVLEKSARRTSCTIQFITLPNLSGTLEKPCRHITLRVDLWQLYMNELLLMIICGNTCVINYRSQRLCSDIETYEVLLNLTTQVKFLNEVECS